MNGWLLIDKPIGITSFQSVNSLQKLLGVKIGHCGTLDPFASGFLLVAINKATKLVEYVMNFEKNYSFDVQWGTATDTDDLTGTIINNCSIIPKEDEILEKLSTFIGNIDQVPPIFSAIKVNGIRAYQYARKGIDITLKPRQVKLSKFSLLEHKDNISSFNIVTGKGFYVRSLARDLARSLNTFAHVIKLRRNLNGVFHKKNMVSYEKTNDFLHKTELYDYIMSRVLPLDYVLSGIHTHHLDLSESQKLRNGQHVFVKSLTKDDSKVAVKNGKELVALCSYIGGFLRPIKIF